MAASRSTIHFVYVTGGGIAAPQCITREVTEALRALGPVEVHDWSSRESIRPKVGDILIGHPHPDPSTIFRRSIDDPMWKRKIILSPFAHRMPEYIAFLDPYVEKCDRYLAISGRYWHQSLDRSLFSHWKGKIEHIDLAVRRDHYPRIKNNWNPRGQRRCLYVGSLGKNKGTDVLARLAKATPEFGWGWIGSGSHICDSIEKLGPRDFSLEASRRIVAGYDFLVHTGRSDANPTTVLEGAAWGLIPVCTQESGYTGEPWIIPIPLASVSDAAAVLRSLNEMPDEELDVLRSAADSRLDTHYTWQRFTAQVLRAICDEIPHGNHAVDTVQEAKDGDGRRSNSRILAKLARRKLIRDKTLHRFVRIRLLGQGALRRIGRLTIAYRKVNSQRIVSTVRNNSAGKSSFRDAVHTLRMDPNLKGSMEAAYLDGNAALMCERFSAGEEWREVQAIVTRFKLGPCRVLDLGAGSGFASVAFARNGFMVIAVDESDCIEFGTQSLSSLVERQNLRNIRVLHACGEKLPLPDASIDLVYSRQVLHHVQNLQLVAREVGRVLRPGGVWIATREHVVSDAAQLEEFLSQHPIHALCSNEHAYTLAEYVESISSALVVRKILGPYDSAINHYPIANCEIQDWLTAGLQRCFGDFIGGKLSETRIVQELYRRRLSRACVIPGRMYSFISQNR